MGEINGLRYWFGEGKGMKIIIAGPRAFQDEFEELVDVWVEDAVRESGFKITEVVSGKARGIDRAGERFAKRWGIPVAEFPVTNTDWNIHGKIAGHLRNAKMADYGDGLIVVWDGYSKGTANMINEASFRGLPVFIYLV